MAKKKKNQNEIRLEDLALPTYEEIKKEIKNKIGTMPSRPKNLPKGEWSKQALKVLEERYLVKDDNGKPIETPEDMCWRVSWEIASAEARWGAKANEVKKRAREFYNILIEHSFLPNSPTLMNAGTNNMLQFSACFVLPVEDSMGGIFDALKYQALIHKSGGGTGFAFSRLRPQGAIVKSSSGVASGPVSFMRIFDAATNEVKQGGKRRGANMGILRVDHPDILEFIHCKEDGGITNFNISVAITDRFMEAYEKGEDYELIDPNSKEVVGRLSARKVFDEIADGAWRTGDPGLVFLDRINSGEANPIPPLGPVEATNPCGEQPLYPFDSCNLGSIFLSYFITEKNNKKDVDWEKLRDVTRVAVRFLDNVIEMNPYPLDPIRQVSMGIRRIGLGVGGWADLLIDLGIPYDSEEALKLGEKVMKVIQEEAVSASEQLAKERGPFPMFPVSIYKDKKPRRNSTVTTIAPTGTISIIAGTSSGIEPIFAIAYQHIVKDKHLSRTLTFINPKFEEIAKERGFWSEEIKEKVAEHGTIRDIEEIPEDVRNLFGTAHEIHHDWHIKMQSAFQNSTENAVSKTINMRNEVSVDDVKDSYLLAWKTKCKGITIFRDGCKDAQVLNLGVKDKEVKEENPQEDYLEPMYERPIVVMGATYKLNTPQGKAFITINEDEEGQPLEVFINIGKAGSDVTAMAAALGRTISTAFRFKGGVSAIEKAREITEQLAGIGGRRSVGFGPTKILSLPDAVAAALSMHFNFKMNGMSIKSDTNGISHAKIEGNGSAVSTNGVDHSMSMAAISAGTNGASEAHVQESLLIQVQPKVTGDICPACGASSLVYQEGCAKCHACGHSEC